MGDHLCQFKGTMYSITIMSNLSIPSRKTVSFKNSNKPKRSTRSKVTIVILIVVALGSLIVIVLPYIPRLRFLLTRPKIDPISYQQAAKATKKGETTTPTKQPGNRLILASIGVNAQIIEGKNIYVIGKNQGVWHETPIINPTTPGNIVIAGHRFLYTATNGGYFNNLPELKLNDKIFVQWNDKVYEYQVYNSKTVLPTQVDIRDNDPNVPKKLTMYTCYPLGSTAKRFVIEAKQL